MILSRVKELFSDKYSEDIHRLTAAFPAELQEDVINAAKVIPFAKNSIKLADGKEHFIDMFVSDYKPQAFNLKGEIIKIPYRVYFENPEPDQLLKLNKRQRTIVNCIYLRHHDGFVRENHLARLIESDDYFVTPFIIQILGEYVMELINILDQCITDQIISEYAEFLSDNRLFGKQTQSRIVSYWDVYYRQQFPNLRDYPGQRLSNRLNKSLRNF